MFGDGLQVIIVLQLSFEANLFIPITLNRIFDVPRLRDFIEF